MGNRDHRFRILAVFLSILFFCIGIVLTLGIFLPIAGLTQSNHGLFAVGLRVFSVYGFSSFLIPLLFLYGAVLLLIPGWTRESKAVLLGVPFYFITAIIGERLIYAFAPSVSIPLVRQFVTVSILICALLLVCFEIFLMLILSEKLSGKHFSLSNIPTEDTVSENAEPDSSDTKDTTASFTPPVPETEDTPTNSPEETSAETPIPPESDTDTAFTAPINTAGTVQERPEAAAVSGASTDTEETAFNPLSADSAVDTLNEHTTDTLEYRSEQNTSVETGIPDTEDMHSETPQSEPMHSTQAVDTLEPTDMEEDDGQQLPLSTPLSAVMDMQEEDTARPVFDPSDPNNLFASLEEITAPVERIKQTGHSEVQTNPLLLEEDAATPIPPEDDVPAGAEEVADTIAQMDIIPEETIPEQQSIAAASQTEADFSDTNSAAETESAAEPDMPLVFVNGVPLPNERSDLLDTMVVIDSETHTNSKTMQEEQSVSSETGSITQNRTVMQEETAPVAPVEEFQDETFVSDIDINEADVPAENISESDIAIDGLDIQNEEDIDDSETDIGAEAAQDTDEKLLETIEQTVPVIPAKPAPPPPPRKKYAIPFDLLTNYPDGEYWIVDDATRRAALMLKSTFNEFKIDVSITGIRKGPVVTMFEMLPSPGIKLSKITNLQDNIALRLAASSVRIVAPIPGKHAVGIEVPNKKRSIVSFRELIETDLPEAAKMAIPVALGKDVTGNPQVLDLAQTPHLLIAGATGSGKSVCVNSIILSILYNRRPDEVKLILVDPKIVELKLYNDIAHLLTPVITEPKRAFQALQYALCEMERRYALLDNMGVRDIKTFNAKIKSERIATETLPYIVIIIDEFADLMATSGKELEATVARLCAMSRAVGIHLVLATQRPSIDVITGLIKANIPSRIAFMVASKTDSRIILDEMGAEKLLGKGDMLYVSAARPFPTRMQGAFVSEQEVERVVACVKEYCEPEYIDEEIFVDDDDEPYDNAVFSDDNDPLYEQALEIVTFAGKASASYVQRKLKIGYNRAARLIEEMEARGIVGPANGSKAREVIRRV